MLTLLMIIDRLSSFAAIIMLTTLRHYADALLRHAIDADAIATL